MWSENRKGSVAGLRFCAYEYQSRSLEELRAVWRHAEDAGFDAIWNCDTVVEPDNSLHPIFDGPATLTAMALATSTIRIGTLVTSQYFRQPVTLVKSAITIDHLSNGRLELALGVGDPTAGAASMGISWSPADAVDRFREFVTLTVLLFDQEVTTFEGRFFRCLDAEMLPRSVQSPRPPIAVAAHGPKMLEIAAEMGDAWSSWGGYGIETEDDLFRVTSDRSARLSELCVEHGRDPASIRRSLVCFPPLTPWESPEYFADMVGRFAAVGIAEFVLYWPRHWRANAEHEDDVFAEVTTEVIPRLRSRGEARTP
jgi:alkanesulfonate monooxygenase SsuD/methylene tetrahydromethanopterin reductase-like flavin-dependent oxidoreductase (luciferase family)